MHQPDAPRTSSKESAKGLIPQWIIWLFIALALFRGLVYAAIFPPWQSPDEHVHFEYAWLVSQHGPFAGPESISLELEQRVLKSMYEFDFWRLVGRPTPETLPSSFTDPSDRWLSLTGPQVGDERPLYYLLAGGFLRLANSRDVVTGMYIGRIVSILLYATAVGATALTARRLFPISPFMQVVPPAFLLFLPMLGQMGAATNTDAMGVLTSTLFFASLIPVFRGRLNWQRIGTAIVTLVLALLSKKTALYLIPTALLVPPIYVWAKGVKFSRQLKAVLASSAVLLILAITVLALLPSGDANGWLGWTGSCGATRVEKNALEGKAALRVGTCADAIVSQMLQPEAVKELAGQQVSLRGWARSATGETVGQVSIADSEGLAQVQVVAEEEWLPFALTHTVSAGARWVGVRLAWEEQEKEHFCSMI